MSAQPQSKEDFATDHGYAVDSDSPVLGKIGNLETRLARSEAEIHEAQALRYQVFYKEMQAKPGPEAKRLKRDKDALDQYCDHLLVIDTEGTIPRIVGTYRMMRQAQARAAGRFYTQSEYELEPLLMSHPDSRLLELGRSCILPNYRSKRTMELLWHGTWAHAVGHEIDIMFGCASFEGTNPSPYAPAFSWLAQYARLPADEDCAARSGNHITLSEFAVHKPDLRCAMAAMPPLLKGYLRLGAQVGSNLVIDHQFGTIDILVVVKVDRINPRYLAHFGADASRFAT